MDNLGIRTRNTLRLVSWLATCLVVVLFAITLYRAQTHPTSAMPNGIVQIAAGQYHSLALTTDGNIYAWGGNTYGQLGNGSTANSNTPVLVTKAGTPMAGKTITQIAAGDLFSLALASDGTVYAWGHNDSGQLGNNSMTDSPLAVAVVTSGVLSGKTVTKITAGAGHSAALTSEGKVYSWGYGEHGQLGNNAVTDSPVPVAVVTTGVLSGKVITQIDGGFYHTVALSSDGLVYSWGWNDSGQLGNNSTTDSRVPVAVNTSGVLSGKSVTNIAAGAHSFVVANSQLGYAWGYNEYGQLGNNSTTDSRVPVAVNTSGVLSGKNLAQIDASETHSLAIDNSGIIYSWGNNNYGQLGNNSTSTSRVPVAVNTSGVLSGKTVTQAAAGFYHSLALGSDGKVYAWGRNNNGQLGNSSGSNSPVPVLVTMTGIPSGTPSAPNNISQTSTDGQVTVSWSPPITTYGQPITSYLLQYRAVNSSTWLTQTDISSSSTSYTKTGLANGTKYQFRIAAVTSYGTGDYSAITLATPHATPTITSVSPAMGTIAGGTTTTINGANFSLKGKDSIQVASGNYHSLALSSDGQVYTWGHNNYGQLGNNSTASSSVPVAINTSGALANKTITAIATGNNHSLALASDGTVYSWGLNNNGQLGNNTSGPGVYSSVPVAVTTTGALSGKTIVAITAGYNSSLALASDGTVYGWGYNAYGELGDGTANNTAVPVAVTTTGVLSGKTIVAIASGDYFSLALASDGTVYSWGWNTYGQLGNNSTAFSLVPTAVNTTGVLSGKTITSIAAGGGHSLALSSDGQVYSWGYNGGGQLGNNSTTNSSVPVATNATGILSGKTVTSITAGSSHSLAIASDGQVYSWGYGYYGQLGNGSTTDYGINPVAVTTTGVLNGKIITNIAGGYNDSFAVACDGTIYAWGYNNYGQLGNNSTTDYLVPVAVDVSSSSALYPSIAVTTFDGVAATGVTLNNPTSITAITPPHAIGNTPVAINLGDGDPTYSATKTNAYTYATTPGVPQSLTATPTDNGVSLAWAAPASNGGNAISSYTIRYRASGGSTWTEITGVPSTTREVTGLTAGVTYEFQTAAVNAIGTGAFSNSVAAARRSITLSSTNATATVSPSGGTRMSSVNATATVTTNGIAGYQLMIGATTRNLVNGSYTIPYSTATQTSPSTLSNSLWGYRVNGVGGFGSTTTAETNASSSAYTWAGIPAIASPNVIRNQTNAASGDVTTIWYGVSSTSTQASGTYSTIVTYTAINN